MEKWKLENRDKITSLEVREECAADLPSPLMISVTLIQGWSTTLAAVRHSCVHPSDYTLFILVHVSSLRLIYFTTIK